MNIFILKTSQIIKEMERILKSMPALLISIFYILRHPYIQRTGNEITYHMIIGW